MTILFLISTPKVRKSGIFGPKSKDFILHQTLQLDKFEGVDFKYDNGFFEF